MNNKQKEALIIALAEKGETYREITKKAGVSPNTIKAVLNRAGLDESTSIHSRAFELFLEGKTPLQVAIKLNLEAEVAIQYHQQYFMLLGCTEFTKIYLQIKDNPWPYVNLVKLTQNARMGYSEVVELLKIANGYLPRVRLEYDRRKEEKSSLQAELNSWKAELTNIARTYQQFCDKNLELKKREDELLLSINELEVKETELQMNITGLKQQLSEFRENNLDNAKLNPEFKQEDIISFNDVLIPSPDTAINYHQSENEMLPKTLIFDTKDLGVMFLRDQ